MPTYGMGDAIREMRRRLGYTQEELSFGVCTTGTLSRIENGKAIVSKQVFEALCDRMPGLHHAGVSLDTKLEMKRSKLCKKILLHLEHRNMSEAREAMQEYQQLMEEKNPFCRQFKLYTQAIYEAISGDGKEVLHKLEEAMQITMPDYESRLQEGEKRVLFTYDEIYILINIGIACAREEDMEKANRLLYCLKLYTEHHGMDMIECPKVYVMVVGNLAWVLERQGRFQEAVRLCDAGINTCCFSGKCIILPYLLCLKSWCLTALGNPMTAKKCKQQAKTILDITENHRGYGSFEEFYKAKEPIYVTF